MHGINLSRVFLIIVPFLIALLVTAITYLCYKYTPSYCAGSYNPFFACWQDLDKVGYGLVSSMLVGLFANYFILKKLGVSSFLIFLSIILLVVTSLFSVYVVLFEI